MSAWFLDSELSTCSNLLSNKDKVNGRDCLAILEVLIESFSASLVLFLVFLWQGMVIFLWLQHSFCFII